MVRVVVVVGARAEAIKLAPVVVALHEAHDLEPWVVVTGPCPTPATEALGSFGLTADVVADVPSSGGGPADLLGHLLPRLGPVVAEATPGAVVVQGAAVTALAGALAGFWQQVPVAHLDAGLRIVTADGRLPVEEVQHRVVSRLVARHLAPTPGAAANLLAEGIDPATVVVTGSTAVDAVHLRSEHDARATPRGLADRRIALLTIRRRDSGDAALPRILAAARAVVDATPDLRLVVPLPAGSPAHDAAHLALGDHPRVVLSDELPHPGLTWLLSQAAIAITDSDGIQEEAPSFGTPVVVLRDVTERPEAVRAGTAWLVGTDPEAIVDRALAVLAEGPGDPGAAAPANPFGDGLAAPRVVGSLRELVHGAARPADWAPDDADWVRLVPVAAEDVAATWTPHRPTTTAEEWIAAVEAPRFEPVTIEPLRPTEAPVDGDPYLPSDLFVPVAPIVPLVADGPTGPLALTDGLPPVAPVSVPGRAEALRRDLADAVPDGLRLGPPTPTRRSRDDGAVGEVVEHRRGTQILRHLPDLVPEWPTPGPDVRIWRIGLDEGEVWMETAGWPIELGLGGGTTATVRGGAATARWDIARGLVRVTVVTGRVDLQPTDGPGRAVGPRQVVEVSLAGELGREERLGPDRLDDDPWVSANRRLSHAHPASRQPAVDTLMLLSDL